MSISIGHATYHSTHAIGARKTEAIDGASVAQRAEKNTRNKAQAAAGGGPVKPLLSAEDQRLLSIRGLTASERSNYEALLARFHGNPGHRSDPIGFLETLSPEGINLLRRAQSLGDGTPIDLTTMSTEEAINFIVPHSGKVDLNNDGMIGGPGGSLTFTFPPPNAPQSVKDAWDAATVAMSEGDKMLLSGQFMSLNFLANFQRASDGSYTVTEPGDSGWRNPFAAEGFSYGDAVDDLLANNEASRPSNTAEAHRRMKGLLEQLQASFRAHGIT